MKLSEMSTDQASDVLVIIAEPAANIMTEPKVTSALSNMSKAKKAGKTVSETYGAAIGKLIPALLQTHRGDVYCIIAAMTEKTIEQVGQQNIKVTISDIKGLWDEELADFFKSAAASEQAEPSQPSQPADQ